MNENVCLHWWCWKNYIVGCGDLRIEWVHLNVDVVLDGNWERKRWGYKWNGTGMRVDDKKAFFPLSSSHLAFLFIPPIEVLAGWLVGCLTVGSSRSSIPMQLLTQFNHLFHEPSNTAFNVTDWLPDSSMHNLFNDVPSLSRQTSSFSFFLPFFHSIPTIFFTLSYQ